MTKLDTIKQQWWKYTLTALFAIIAGHFSGDRVSVSEMINSTIEMICEGQAPEVSMEETMDGLAKRLMELQYGGS